MRPADLPASTLNAAKQVLLDASGVMLGASGLAQEPRAFIALARASGPGPCTILGTAERVSAPMAAFANGAMAHALDYEDAFDQVPGHPNASLVPALLALAQAEGPVDGQRFLTALALGSDLACRMALALRQPMEIGGWYPPPILAGFGAVAGAANLLGLSAVQTRDALSLMLCQTVMPGEIKYSQGTVIRAVREAFPAQAAVLSVLLAREGVAGFEQPLEGRAGFFALFAGGHFAESDLVDGLGRRFWIERLTFKPWPSCRGTHPFIEMALELRRAHDIDPAQIAAIEVAVDDVQQMLVEPARRKAAPEVAIDAKFSVPFVLAIALARGRVGLDDFGAGSLGDRQVLELAAKVSATVAPEDSWQRGEGGRMSIRMIDGRSFEASIDSALGCPERPLDESARIAKFIDCAGRAARSLGQDAAERLAGRILGLENCPDVGKLFAGL
jgi:2-methylcitrate dehydratase PrpD